MTLIQKLQLKQSELREKINALISTEEKTEAQDAELIELSAAAQKIEPELRAALIVEPPPDAQETEVAPEERERVELRGKAKLGRYLAAVLGGRPVDGAEREYSDACDCEGRVPLELFEPDRPLPSTEFRAVTPGVDASQVPASTSPYVFDRTAAASLGIVFDPVEQGVRAYPTISTAPPAGPVDKGAAALATAAAFALGTRSPKRVASSITTRLEDLAVFPDLEDALRESMMDAVGSAVDKALFTGTGANGQVEGLFEQATDVTKDTDELTFANAVLAFSNLVDGRHAVDLSSIRTVIGSRTFGKMASTFATGSPSVSVYDYLQSKLGSIRVSNRVPSFAAKGQKSISTLNSSGMALRVPVWTALELVVDPFTGAGTGTRVITATALIGSAHIPHSTAQLKILHPKLAA